MCACLCPVPVLPAEASLHILKASLLSIARSLLATPCCFPTDADKHYVRQLSMSKGMVYTVAGTGSTAATDGEAYQARFNSPKGIAWGTGGLDATTDTAFIADGQNALLRVLRLPPLAPTAAMVPPRPPPSAGKQGYHHVMFLL